MISSMRKNLTKKKKYLWFVPEDDSIIEMKQAPRSGSEDKAHVLTLVDKRDGEAVIELNIAAFYIGEV